MELDNGIIPNELPERLARRAVEAGENSSGPKVKRTCTEGRSTQSERKWWPPRIPAEGSLQGIIRQLSRSRLYVPAIAWTQATHLSLLGVKFERITSPPPTKAAPQESRDHDEQHEGTSDEKGETVGHDSPGSSDSGDSEHAGITLACKKAVKRLHSGCATSQKQAMLEILDSFDLTPAQKLTVECQEREAAGSRLCNSSLPEKMQRRSHTKRYRVIQDSGFRDDGTDKTGRLGRVELRFGEQTTCSIRPDGIFEPRNKDGCIAYVHFGTISEMRRNDVWGYRCQRSRWNKEVIAHVEKKLQLLQPAMACEDPYIAGVLLALAQKQRCQSQNKQDGDGEAFFKVHAIGVSDSKAKQLFLYTANVGASFLDRLAKPYERTDSPGMVIRYYPIRQDGRRKVARAVQHFLRDNGLCTNI